MIYCKIEMGMLHHRVSVLCPDDGGVIISERTVPIDLIPDMIIELAKKFNVEVIQVEGIPQIKDNIIEQIVQQYDKFIFI